MKILLAFALSLMSLSGGISQNTEMVASGVSTANTPSITVIATVIDADQDYMLIQIEEVTAYSTGIHVTPESGDELTVRLPGREMPKKESRIEVNLKESIDVGALPSSYIMVDYRTID